MLVSDVIANNAIKLLKSDIMSAKCVGALGFNIPHAHDATPIALSKMPPHNTIGNAIAFELNSVRPDMVQPFVKRGRKLSSNLAIVGYYR